MSPVRACPRLAAQPFFREPCGIGSFGRRQICVALLFSFALETGRGYKRNRSSTAPLSPFPVPLLGRSTMRAVWIGSLVLGLSLAGWSRADDSTEAKAVIDKAVKAMGGADKVAKFKSANFKVKLTAQEDGKDLAVAAEGLW